MAKATYQMKRFTYPVVLGVMSMGLAGCVTKQNPAHTEVFYPGVGTVDYHCPPGHRKKGQC